MQDKEKNFEEEKKENGIEKKRKEAYVNVKTHLICFYL